MQAALHAACELHFPGAGLPHRVRRPATGKFNETLFFDLSGRELVFRLSPPADSGLLFYERGMMAREVEALRLARARTAIPVPEILVYDDTRQAAPEPFMVEERLPGEPLAPGAAETEETFRQVGSYLRELHEITGSKFGYVGGDCPAPEAGTWAEAFAAMWQALLDDIVACGGYTEAEADLLRELYARDRDAFARDIPARLLHMDVWHQNILVDESGLISGLLDWDRSLWGDPELEFAVLDYCGVSSRSFWEGYGAERESGHAANVRNIYYYLYELQKYIVIRTLRDQNPLSGKRYALEALRIAREIR